MNTPDARLTKHNIIANLSMMRDPAARHFRHALLGAAADDMAWREGRDAAAAEFYRHADWLIAGDPKSEGPAIPELTKQQAVDPGPAPEPEPENKPGKTWLWRYLLNACAVGVAIGFLLGTIFTHVTAGGGL